jgi:hypothetical protein
VQPDEHKNSVKIQNNWKFLRNLLDSNPMMEGTPARLLLKAASLARPEGFEPPTPRSVVWCSVQLSYGRRYVEIFRAKLIGFRDFRPLTPRFGKLA